jgi:hypothetical protein
MFDGGMFAILDRVKKRFHEVIQSHAMETLQEIRRSFWF